jgi:cytochrome P450
MVTPLYPPGPKTKWPGGQLWSFRRDPLQFLTNLAREHGDIVHFRIGPAHLYLFSHPDLIRDVLVSRHDHFIKGRGLQRSKKLIGEGLLTNEGESYRRQRRLAQPAFHRQRIATYANAMVEHAVRMRERWRAGAIVDVSQEMSRLTLAIVGKTLFNSDTESDADEVGAAMAEIMEMFNFMWLPYIELLEKLPLPHSRRFQNARDQLDRIIYRMIDEHRRAEKDQGDLLSMLLMAQDEETGGGGMTDEQLRDEAMTIFLAGHETTANWLVWTWYLLSQHSEVEKKLHDEIDSVLTNGREPTIEDIPRLPYVEKVLFEAMRLYPPAWTLGRQAIKDYEINGYLIEKGSTILLSQYVMHHHPRYFRDPETFDPERFTPEAREARPQFAYFPFGGGPRRCIGESFALMEGVLLLVTLAARFRLRLVPGHPVELYPRITLRPKHGMRMTIEERK